jgi:hypothetical protein
MGTMKAETMVMRQHIVGMIGAPTIPDMELAGMKVRIERIERRRELTD